MFAATDIVDRTTWFRTSDPTFPGDVLAGADSRKRQLVSFLPDMEFLEINEAPSTKAR